MAGRSGFIPILYANLITDSDQFNYSNKETEWPGLNVVLIISGYCIH